MSCRKLATSAAGPSVRNTRRTSSVSTRAPRCGRPTLQPPCKTLNIARRPAGVRKAFQLKGAHKAECYGVAFAPAAPRMATCSKDGTVAVWNIDVRYFSGEDPRLMRRWESALPGRAPYSHVALSPDAQYVAACSGSTIHVFTSEGELKDTIEEVHTGGVTGKCAGHVGECCPRLMTSS